jgi:hypothetical protein
MSPLRLPSKTNRPPPVLPRVSRLELLAGVLSLALFVGLVIAGVSQAATAVGLGTADSYAVLAGAGVTNKGPTVLNGDLGTAPTPAITGFGGAPNGTVNGATHQADAEAAQAQGHLTTAYDNAAGQGPANTLETELGGASLTPGVYDSESGTFGITGVLTLNGQGNPNAVFIFKTATTLITASASSVNFVNGAQPCNVFWKVGSSATLGSGSVFAGNILALESISLNDAVTVAGRLLARDGAVTLINDVVTRADCATPATGGDVGGTAGSGSPTSVGVNSSVTTVGNRGGKGGNGGKAGNRKGNGKSNAGPIVSVNGVPRFRPGGPGGRPPTTTGRVRCVEKGFLAKFRIQDTVAMRRVEVLLDGELIKRTDRKVFSVQVDVAGLRSGRNTIRVRAVDRKGRVDVASRSFHSCSAARPTPSFTG